MNLYRALIRKLAAKELGELRKQIFQLNMHNDDLRERLKAERLEHQETKGNVEHLVRFINLAHPVTVKIDHNDVSQVRL